MVLGWATLFEKRFGGKGRIYPTRDGADVRYHLDLDDRVAGDVVRWLESGPVQKRSAKQSSPKKGNYGHRE